MNEETNEEMNANVMLSVSTLWLYRLLAELVCTTKNCCMNNYGLTKPCLTHTHPDPTRT